MRKEKLLERGPVQAYCGIIQVRCESPAKLEDISSFIRAAAGPMGISKITIAKEGFDFYLVSRSTLHRLQGCLAARFGGYTKSSNKLVTKNRLSSKLVYRSVIFFRAFPFQVGDIILLEKHPLKLLKISERVSAKDLATGKTISFKFEERVKIQQLTPETAHISQYHPHLMLLHPHTYQPVRPENQAGMKRDSYEIVVVGERVYII